jgi:phenylpropionate dioxygenase-like ring-hydroxylating dioxygenase large terminal subunit
VKNPAFETKRASASSALSGIFDAERGTLLPRAFVDPAIYALELERIFSRSWLFICHEGHIPKPGDFFTTYMAQDPVIAVRQKDGGVKVLLNMCRHRGMRICRSDQGNTKAFTCSYHGWAYDLSGKLVSVPYEKEVCGPGFSKSAWSVRAVPRVENYRGMIFACWNEEVPPLAEYLGDFKLWLDVVLDRRPAHATAIGGMYKWVIPCNWKLAAEQFASDMLHADTTHLSALVSSRSADIPPEWPPAAMKSGQVPSAGGHGTGFFTYPDGIKSFHDGSGIQGRWADLERFRKSRAAHNPLLDRVMIQHLTLFPNFSVVTQIDSFRVWHPRGPGEIEVWAFTVLDADASPEERNRHRLANIRAFSPAGTFEQDDGENWVEVQRTFAGTEACKTPLALQFGLGRTDWVGDPTLPGSSPHCMNESAARSFYGRWLEMLSTEGSSKTRVAHG